MKFFIPCIFKKYNTDYFFTLFFFLLISASGYSQDIESSLKSLLAKKDAPPLKVSGGFNSGFTFYNMSGIKARRDPFSYALNANMGLKFFNTVDATFDINYNSANKQVESDFKNPVDYFKNMLNGILKRTGISPKYKSVTLHLGDRSMDFSKYTYSGVFFYGVGAEVDPKKAVFSVSGFKGKLQKRILPDTINNNPVEPMYERQGMGTKLSFGKKAHVFNLISFHAKDILRSQENLSPSYGVKPQENLVLGISTKNKITKQIDFKFEYVLSAYTADLRAPEKGTEVADFSYFNNVGSLFTPLLSSRYNKAMFTDIKYKHEFFYVGGEYRRVDPTFVSLGSLNAKNDFIAWTMNDGVILFKQKVIVNNVFGIERNNLAELQTLTMKRLIGSVDVTYTPVAAWTFSGAYSNFNFSTSPSVIDLVDTIKIVQVNASENLMVVHTFGEGDIKHTLSANTMLQKTQDIQDFGLTTSTVVNTVNNQSLSYGLNLTKIKATAAFSLMYTEVSAPGTKQKSIGPGFTASKAVMKNKITLNLAIAILSSKTTGGEEGSTINYKLGAKYPVNKHHSLKLDVSLVDKTNKTDTSKSFKEFQAKLAYNYVF